MSRSIKFAQKRGEEKKPERSSNTENKKNIAKGTTDPGVDCFDQ